MAMTAPPTEDMTFRPERFFLGRTQGAGVVRDAFSRIQRRCRVATIGTPHAAYGAIEVTETMTFDDGKVEVWRWVISGGGQGGYVAAEASAGSGFISEPAGEDLVFAFARPNGGAKGLFTPNYVSRFTLLAEDLAIRTAKKSVLGAPIETLTAVYRRVTDQIRSRPAA